MTAVALSYLRKQEWSMGNGQCPECCGCKLHFDHPDSPVQRRQGHKRNCKLAAAIKSLSGTILWGHQPPLTKKGQEAQDAWNAHLVPIYGMRLQK